MKKSLLLLTLYFFVITISQSQNEKKGTYIPLKLYKNLYNRSLTQKDSANFKIKNNDTLVFIKDRLKLEKLLTEKSKNNGNTPILKSETRSYMPIDQYRKRYKKKITEEDIANSKMRKGDTLILISNKDFYKNRIRVPYQPIDSSLLEIYKDVVFQKYRNNENSKKTRMRYWKDDIKIYYSENVNKAVKKEITAFAKYLSKNVDSLDIEFVNSVEKSNYVVYGLNSNNDYNYEPKLKSGDVNFYVYWNGKQQIYNAKLLIDSRAYDNEEDLVLKSKKMFLNTLGYFSYTYKLPKQSYFSLWKFANKQFTEDDLEILKYHYSYGICKGTDLETFEDQYEKGKASLKNGRKLYFVHEN